jgi:predicted Zn-ribbon and HTH transcriptional regulator
MKNYQCNKCGTVIQANSLPNVSGCPKSSSHNWHNLGETGDKNYQCKKCETTVKANSLPNVSGCPNSSSHSWSKL